MLPGQSSSFWNVNTFHFPCHIVNKIGDKMYLLTEWEGRTEKYLARGQGLTKSQIFSRPARPYSVNKHFIMWPLAVENFENYKIRRLRARNNYLKVSSTKICQLFLLFFLSFYFFASNRKLTIHRKHNSCSHFCSSIAIHTKKPTESWYKAVKNMSKPSKT